MSKLSQLKVRLDTVVIAEYENYIVYALYMDNKFTSTLTVDINSN